jgi:molybdopterin/thiamine biosynthesis adenylyltransferase/rhodanese-related sulfurtransferase
MAENLNDRKERGSQPVRELDVRELKALLDRGPDGTVVVDVRETDEVDHGYIAGAVHVPSGDLAANAEGIFPDKAKRLVLYCAVGVRSSRDAGVLQRIGYGDVLSLRGGFVAWRRAGHPVAIPSAASRDRLARYDRHIRIPEIGREGQLKLLESRILVIGAGGLGSPAAIYLAAAGVGTLGLVDDDVVDESNLQRQILHRTSSVGAPKTLSAKETLLGVNPDVRVNAHQERFVPSNALRMIGGYDVVIDGSDNFGTKYLVNDACVLARIPYVHGSIQRFEGQVTVVQPGAGPCYRCLFRAPAPEEIAPSCAEAGVLGVLPGVIGVLQATEALKLLLGLGRPLVGRIMQYDALEARFREFKVLRDPACPVCGEHPVLRSMDDYGAFLVSDACRARNETGD